MLKLPVPKESNFIEKLPKKKAIPTHIGLSAAANAYANALNTDKGEAFADECTWASVVVGVGLTLLFLRLVLPREHWQRVFIALAVAGGPMVTQSLKNEDVWIRSVGT